MGAEQDKNTEIPTCSNGGIISSWLPFFQEYEILKILKSKSIAFLKRKHKFSTLLIFHFFEISQVHKGIITAGEGEEQKVSLKQKSSSSQLAITAPFSSTYMQYTYSHEMPYCMNRFYICRSSKL